MTFETNSAVLSCSLHSRFSQRPVVASPRHPDSPRPDAPPRLAAWPGRPPRNPRVSLAPIPPVDHLASSRGGRNLANVRIGRRSQVVRQWTANPPCVGSTPTGASSEKKPNGSKAERPIASRRAEQQTAAERSNNRLQPDGRTTDCSRTAEQQTAAERSNNRLQPDGRTTDCSRTAK